MQTPRPDDLNVSEDCLYLNLWSPVKPNSMVSTPKTHGFDEFR